MAKFKVGDVVSVKREAAEMIDNPALARKRGRVTKVLPGGYYEVDGELGATGLELTDAELTLANSRACNAKFKVGDRVRRREDGIVGTVTEDVAYGLVRVTFSDGSGGVYNWNEVTLANSRACNAKFRPGDLAYIKKTGEVCKVLAEMPRQAGKTVYKLKIIEGPYRGEEEGLFESDLLSEAEHLRSLGKNALRSRNAVVAKALNACGTARNAESPEDYDGNMHRIISSIAHDLEKTVLQLGKAVSLWEKADKSEYAKGEAEKALALDRRLYSLVISALQYMRKAEQASA